MKKVSKKPTSEKKPNPNKRIQTSSQISKPIVKIKPQVKPAPRSAKKSNLLGPSGTKGIIEDIGKVIKVGESVADTIVSTIENPIDGIINKLPNTVATFVDAMGGNKTSLNPNAPGQVSMSGELKTSKDEKFVDALKKEMPVVQLTAIPSGFAADYKSPPISITDTKWNNIPSTRVSGSVILGSINNGTGGLVRHQSRILNPSIMGGQLASISQLHQKHLWLNIGLFYIPTCSSTQLGQVILSFQNSPNVTYSATANINLLSQRDHFVMSHCFKGMSLPLVANFKQQYNRPSGTPSGDPKFYADWAFEVWTDNVQTANPATTLGSFGIVYDVLFFSKIESDAIEYPQQISGSLMCFSSLKTSQIIQGLRKLLDGYLSFYNDEFDSDLEMIGHCRMENEAMLIRSMKDKSLQLITVEKLKLLCSKLMGFDQFNLSLVQTKFLIGLEYVFLSFNNIFTLYDVFSDKDERRFVSFLHCMFPVLSYLEQTDEELQSEEI